MVKATVVGHLGTDVVRIGARSSAVLPGGALWHFVLGFSILGPPVTALCWGDRSRLEKIFAATAESSIQWKVVDSSTQIAEFEMVYAAGAEDLTEIEVSLPPMPSAETILPAPVNGAVHLCTMPWGDIERVGRRAKRLGMSSVSLQFHKSVMPSRRQLLNSVIWPPRRVFLTDEEFDQMGVEAEGWARGYEVEWVVTSRHHVRVLSDSHDLTIDVAPDGQPFDTTAAGDLLAGAYTSVVDAIGPRSAAKFAAGVANWSIDDWTSQGILRALQSRWSVSFGDA